jgi:hypothetical protein
MVFLHLGHGGGTFVCENARLNCERSRFWGTKNGKPKWKNCNMIGDVGKRVLIRGCSERKQAIYKARYSIVGHERGFHSGEFCPANFDYMLLLRHPLDRIDSLASTYARNSSAHRGVPASELISAIRAGTWKVRNFENMLEGYGMLAFDNALVRYAAADSQIYQAPLGTIDVAAFEKAKRTLNQFSFVMTLELIKREPTAAAALILRSPLNWTLFPQDQLESKKVNHHQHHILTEEEVKFFTYLNRYDIKLWEYISSLENRTISGLAK